MATKKKHDILHLDYREIECLCGWRKELDGSWGIQAGYDRLLDLHNIHRKQNE